MKSEAMKVGVVGVGRVGAACASTVALVFGKENASAVIKELEKQADVVSEKTPFNSRRL
jgi:lactate dehydrogenase-like 2-hydroxyacid dehydrogenase